MAPNGEDSYVLRRDIVDSVRLDAQHLMWKLHKGYVLHPLIPVTERMKIAEIGSETAVWIFDLVPQLPPSVHLHGFDISDSQYPPKELWPKNVSLGLLDSLSDPPESFRAQYDVVHLRLWACILRGNDILSLIHHAKSLLKPGGYIQWEDADLTHQNVKGATAQEFERRITKIFQDVDLHLGWATNLPSTLQNYNFSIIEAESSYFQSYLAQLCTNTYLFGLRSVLKGIKRQSARESRPLINELEALLDQLCLENTKGIVYNWSPVSVLAQNASN
ncbi:hypothetical protein BJX96DRAFT_183536 [Aspergillus floccosus]